VEIANIRNKRISTYDKRHLVEHKKTNKWLAEQLGKDPATISKWCTNSSQPSVETLMQIARCLDVEVHELLHPADKVAPLENDQREVVR